MDKREPERKNVERVETAWLGLKAPVEWFEELDAWRELQDFTPKPSRPAAIRSSAMRSAMTLVGMCSASALRKIAPSVSAIARTRRSVSSSLQS